MNTALLSTAERAFRKEQRAAEASQAWREYEANQLAVDANMMRLRALRLAREAILITPAPKKRRVRRAN